MLWRSTGCTWIVLWEAHWMTARWVLRQVILRPRITGGGVYSVFPRKLALHSLFGRWLFHTLLLVELDLNKVDHSTTMPVCHFWGMCEIIQFSQTPILSNKWKCASFQSLLEWEWNVSHRIWMISCKIEYVVIYLRARLNTPAVTLGALRSACHLCDLSLKWRSLRLCTWLFPLASQWSGSNDSFLEYKLHLVMSPNYRSVTELMPP